MGEDEIETVTNCEDLHTTLNPHSGDSDFGADGSALHQASFGS